jgi:hypothetical protein
VAEGDKRWVKKAESDGIEEIALLLLEWLAEQGIDALLRVDAQRLSERRPAWTFAAGGGPLGVGVRADGATAGQCLARAVAQLRELGVEVPY